MHKPWQELTRTQKEKVLRRARRLIRDLYNAQKGLCRWCGHLMELSRPNGKCYRYEATVDHVVALSIGGTNDHGNLVAACYACNNMRNDAHQGHEYAGGQKFCRGCFGPVFSRMRKCNFCRSMDRERYQRLKVLGVLA